MKIKFRDLNRTAQLTISFILFIVVLLLVFFPLYFLGIFDDEKLKTNEELGNEETLESFEVPSDDEVRLSYLNKFKDEDEVDNENQTDQNNEEIEEETELSITDDEEGNKVIETNDISITIPNNQSKNKVIKGTEEDVLDNEVVAIVDPKPTPTPFPKEKTNSNIEKVKDFYGEKYELINIGNNGFDVKRGNEFIHTYEDKLFGVWKWDKESINLASKTLHELGVPLEVNKIESNLNHLIDTWEERIIDNDVEFRLGMQNIWVEW